MRSACVPCARRRGHKTHVIKGTLRRVARQRPTVAFCPEKPPILALTRPFGRRRRIAWRGGASYGVRNLGDRVAPPKLSDCRASHPSHLPHEPSHMSAKSPRPLGGTLAFLTAVGCATAVVDQ